MAATPLLILYGSQTGNAQDVAEAIGRDAAALLFAPRVMPMDAYPVADLPGEGAVVFVAATTGQGEPPENMRRFWRFLLRKSLPPGSLAATRYAVFGLGDSAYVKFNAAAKKLDRRLEALGATPLIERGLGDDQHPGGYEAALDPWLESLWHALRAALPLPGGAAPPALEAAARLRLGPPKFRVTLLGPGDGAGAGPAAANANGAAKGPGAGAEGGGSDHSEEERLQLEAVAAAAAFRAVAAEASGLPPGPEAAAGNTAAAAAAAAPPGPWRPFMAPLLVNRRLTAAGHFQDTRHLEFGLEGSGLTYEPGDLLAIFPRTPEADVEALLARLGLSPGQLLRIEAAAPLASADGAGGAPRAAVVATARAVVLQHYATVEREKERLAYFASPEGRDELYDYNHRERRTLLEVLSDFPSAAPLPLERLLEAAPLLRPRYFSLSSSPLAHPGRAHVTAAVVRYSTPFKRPKRGLVTTWLAGLQPPRDSGAAGPRVPVWVERGCLRMPASPAAPLLLVGPGTGVAPFRSFLWQRAALIRQQQQQQQQQQGEGQASVEGSVAGAAGAVAPCVLFFGCRHPNRDFYYREEWEELTQARALDPDLGLVAAFSRPEGGPGSSSNSGGGGGVTKGGGHYVTHKIKQHGAEVWRLLSSRGAHVYVSGSAEKMPADVAAALEAVASEHGGLGAEAAARWVRQLEAAGRYHVEAWS
ncbi:hypothetical protein Rsub_00986 [Raphidocelis subcapitata]|uniref:NADPH-dependent diflavin oxidoreductase 1 n=1 Tax=Raphidocelis subcapitata TaxID=307507 RepID=A0A2V0NLI0_9CHLO|nr:hypothetical protein Rsub_00986 [Raphidocelis subcapitata]|eukprot:GBF88274.1 hypothetical protein Rsub_00986 [Raphidocelis subcapitata]